MGLSAQPHRTDAHESHPKPNQTKSSKSELIVPRHRQDPSAGFTSPRPTVPSPPPNHNAPRLPGAARERGLLRTDFLPLWRDGSEIPLQRPGRARKPNVIAPVHNPSSAGLCGSPF